MAGPEDQRSIPVTRGSGVSALLRAVQGAGEAGGSLPGSSSCRIRSALPGPNYEALHPRSRIEQEMPRVRVRWVASGEASMTATGTLISPDALRRG